MPVVGAPDIERSFATTHAALALIMFVVPGIVALVCEPVLFLLADRHPRHWFIRGGVGAMAVGSAIAAAAPGPVTFAIGLCVAWVATGTATGLAQATLVDRWPDERGKTLIVTAGLGTSILPLRFGVRPDMWLVTIGPEQRR